MIKRTAGFTLLEILVVLIIIGTVVGIAIPRLNDVFEVDLKSTIRKFAGTAQFCFNESVIRQTPIRLNLSFDSQEYYLSYLATNGSTGEFVELPSTFVDHEQMPDGVFFLDVATPHNPDKTSVGEEFVIFYPTGYVEPAVVHISTRDGRVWTLLFKSMTGKVVVYDRQIDFMDLQNNVIQPTGTTSANGNGSGWGRKKKSSSSSGSGGSGGSGGASGASGSSGAAN